MCSGGYLHFSAFTSCRTEFLSPMTSTLIERVPSRLVPRSRSSRGGAPNPKIVLAVILATYLMIILDATIVITALPKIHRALGFSSTGLTWVQNAYTLTFGGFLLLGARAGDILGGPGPSAPTARWPAEAAVSASCSAACSPVGCRGGGDCSSTCPSAWCSS